MERFWTKEKKEGAKLVSTYRLTMQRFKDESPESEVEPLSQGSYKVKVFHMDTDEFRCTLYPQSWLDTARYFWFTRKHFRIF